MLAELFWAFFQIGLFAIGGGYAALPLIQQQAVTLHGWLSAADFTNLVTISQMTPGPIAINAATFVGMSVSGLPGAITATLGCITPSLLIVSALFFVWSRLRGNPWWDGVLQTLRPVTAGLIGAACVQLLFQALLPEGSASLDWIVLILFVLSTLLIRKTKLSSVTVMVLAGVAMVCLGLLFPSLG